MNRNSAYHLAKTNNNKNMSKFITQNEKQNEKKYHAGNIDGERG